MRYFLLLLFVTSLSHAEFNPNPPDRCWPNVAFPPKVAWGTVGLDGVPEAVSTKYNSWAVWTCATPGGYKNWWYMFDWAEPAKHISKALLGTFTRAEADADCATQCKDDWSQAEADFITLKIKLYGAYARVIRSSAEPQIRSVYARLPNGTRSPTPVPGAGVAVGAECWTYDRITTSKYYLVKNDVNAVDGTPLGEVYAECQFVAPKGVNQP